MNERRRYVAAKLHAFAASKGLLPRSPSAAAAARRFGWEPSATGRFLRALRASGRRRPRGSPLLNWIERGTTAAAAIGSLRDRGKTDDERLLWYSRFVFSRFLKPDIIERCLRTGKCQASTALGLDGGQIFDHYASHAALLSVYSTSFSLANRHANRFAALHAPRGPRQRILDVGGGVGGLTRAFADDRKDAAITLYDHPGSSRVIESLEREWLGPIRGRVERRYGDFFAGREIRLAGLPPGARYDLILMGWILHDWSDERCEIILKKAARHLMPGGALLILEKIRTRRGSPTDIGDFLMLLMADGKERTRGEYEALLRSASLRLTQVHVNPDGRDVLVAR